MEKNSPKKQFIFPIHSTYNMLTSSNGNYEYDKQSKNSHITNKLHKEAVMSQENYKYIEKMQDGLSIILEFPANTGFEEQVKSEIKDILCHVLNEYQEERRQL